jgi:hypothetical protein
VPNNGGGNTYNVTIDSGGTDAVTLDQNATINSLVLGDATNYSPVSTLQSLPGTAGTGGGAVHNNLMVTARSISAARGNASQESSVSATSMARLYVGASFPTSVARTMGCN